MDAIARVVATAMDRFDLSRQAITSLTQVSDDIVQQVEHSADGDDDVEYEYALSLAQNRIIEVHAIGRFQHVAQVSPARSRELCCMFKF